MYIYSGPSAREQFLKCILECRSAKKKNTTKLVPLKMVKEGRGEQAEHNISVTNPITAVVAIEDDPAAGGVSDGCTRAAGRLPTRLEVCRPQCHPTV